MKLRVHELVVHCKRGTEHVQFEGVEYFYGKMGAGKSTIVRLIDFCLGGTLDMTPALQNEFVAATIELTIGGVRATLSRQREGTQVEASWVGGKDAFRLMVPGRKPAGELLPGTGIEVLSDLLMHLAGLRPPRVRKSKVRDDSEMVRLSFRNLFWFCYLDQDSIDSSFFNLERGTEHFRQLQSRDVIRYILGYHQEHVTEMEMDLEEARRRKVRAEEGAIAIARALEATGFGSEDELTQREAYLRQRRADVQLAIQEARDTLSGERSHATDGLQARGRALLAEIQSIDDALAAIERVIDNDQRHRNELITLSMKSRRAADARAVLSQVEFIACPRCTQPLPVHAPGECTLCGQPEADPSADTAAVASVDLNARVAEIDEVVVRHTRQRAALRRERDGLVAERVRVDRELTEASVRYDSAYLSSSLQLERDAAVNEQLFTELARTRLLDEQRRAMQEDATASDMEVAKLRTALVEARAVAERDSSNLQRLQELFLDCLLRARLPGFSAADTVTIAAPNFFPEVVSPGADGTIVTTFSHLGSGGKKTLFKCCFAVALHRLATEIDAPLPAILLIDTAMKNISERENREQFVGFYSLLYDLAANELADTQFVIVDKEYFAPPSKLDLKIRARLMTPDDDANPPLIRYYRGH